MNTSKAKPHILVTNDDGISAPGLQVLADSLSDVGEVYVYAPDRNQSGVGHGISLHRPLRVTPVRDRWFMVDGTPTDCVMLAVRALLDSPPHLVFSGINNGPNMGDDVTYSGTVAGAFEGMLLGLPSVAISIQSRTPDHWETAAECARQLAIQIIDSGLPNDTVLNVNVPDLPRSQISGIEITCMGRRAYEDEIIRREDPRGVAYYWIGGNEPGHIAEVGTDFEALAHNAISVTPLHRDITNFEAVKLLKKQGLTYS